MSKQIHITTGNYHCRALLERSNPPSAAWTTQRAKQMGGWWMTGIDRMCTALYFYRMHMQEKWDESATASWLMTWNLTSRNANPPHATMFPTTLAYLYVYAVNLTHIRHLKTMRSPDVFRRNIYTSLHVTALAMKGACDIRDPAIAWPNVWRNLDASWSSEDIKSGWFMVIHILVPTNDQSAEIQCS